MGGLFGETTSIKAERIGSMRIQTSAYGICLALAYGRTRITGNLMHYSDFKAIKHKESSGGKGGGGVEQTTYTYEATILMGLCEGEINSVKAVWKGKEKQGDKLSNVFMEAHVVPSVAPYTITIANWASDGITTGTGGAKVKRMFSGENVEGQQYTVENGVYTFAPEMAGETVYLTYSKYTPALESLGLSVFTGTTPQAPWSFLVTKHPDQALSYPGVAYVAAAGYALDGSASLENHSFEIVGRLPYDVANGIFDSNPKDVLADFLTNSQYGAGFPSGKLDALTQFSNYCLAAGILISPYWANQRPAHERVEEVTKIGNSATVWSENKLKIIPYADKAINGPVTFTPNVTPLYDLTDDDFLAGNGDPVKVRRKTQADAFNQVQVEFTNRALEYNTDIATAKDQADIEQYGLRPMDKVVLNSINNAGVAQTVANTIRDRVLYVRNEYEFRLGWRYALLEPMDIVTLTDAALGMNKTPVRITEITEDEAGALTVIAEEFPTGVSTPALFPSSVPEGYNPDYAVSPGNVNTPVIFDAPGIKTVTGHEIWAAVSGADENWGGCNVWISFDNAHYEMIGTVYGRSRHGVLSASLADGSDPDTVNSLSVDLTQCLGELLGGTTEEADNLTTLCWVEGELLAYRDATLTAVNKYDLGYLRRGAYRSAKGAHAAGDRFVRCDERLFRHAYDPALIGTTIYLKFTSFNRYGSGVQSLGAVTAYSHVIGRGPSYPTNPTGFTASQNNNVVVFQWAAATDPNVVGADIRYSEQGNADWANASPITQVTKGSQITTAKVPPGTWTFLLAHRDNNGNYSRTPATFNLTVTNTFDLISQVEQAPDWPGTLTNMVKHWTGVLVPDSQNLASAGDWATFDKLSPNPYPLCYYETPEIDIGFDAKDRVWGDIVSTMPPTGSGVADPSLEIDSKLAAGVYDGFLPWTIGTVNARYVKQRIVVDTAIGVPVISGFKPTVDAEEFTQSGTATIGATGATVTFPERYHFAPTVGATAIGATGLIAVISNVTATDFDVHVYDTTNTEVGGDITWDAIGA